jgi:hypothetical protein
MKNEVDRLRVALRNDVDENSSPEMRAVIEEMLDKGMLRHFYSFSDGLRTAFWSTNGSRRMLNGLGHLNSIQVDILELFLEQTVVFRTDRHGVPGIYFLASKFCLDRTEGLIQ